MGVPLSLQTIERRLLSIVDVYAVAMTHRLKLNHVRPVIWMVMAERYQGTQYLRITSLSIQKHYLTADEVVLDNELLPRPHINRFDAFYVALDAIIALDLVQTPGKEWMHGIQTRHIL